MNTSITRLLPRKSTLAAVLAVAALFAGGCSTAPVARMSSDKAGTYAELHGMMVKLAQETAQANAGRQVEIMASSEDSSASRTLASNP